jgi:ferredoxin-NADP reductase
VTKRSYSVASEPERAGEIDLTVEQIESGEVSPYLHDVLAPGDQIEVRGPIGGHFVWEAGPTCCCSSPADRASCH